MLIWMITSLKISIDIIYEIIKFMKVISKTYPNEKPWEPKQTAILSFSSKISMVEYSGISIWFILEKI